MPFDISIYKQLLTKAELKIGLNKKYFTAGDIVHNLYLKEEIITLDNASYYMIPLIKKETSSGVNFCLNHKIFEDTYVCSKCHEPKPVGAFRIRNENRETYFDYINDKCLDCEINIKKDYHHKNKDNSEYKNKAAKRAKEWHWSNRELVLQYQKQRRQTEEYKIKMKEYRTCNQSRIRQKAKEARERRKSNFKTAA